MRPRGRHDAWSRQSQAQPRRGQQDQNSQKDGPQEVDSTRSNCFASKTDARKSGQDKGKTDGTTRIGPGQTIASNTVGPFDVIAKLGIGMQHHDLFPSQRLQTGRLVKRQRHAMSSSEPNSPD